MSIETCIAHAIHKDLDIIEAMPEVQDLPVEQLETYVESFIFKMQESLCNIIEAKGDLYLRAKDAAGLCAACLESGVGLPPRMLLRMCQTIIPLSRGRGIFQQKNIRDQAFAARSGASCTHARARATSRPNAEHEEKPAQAGFFLSMMYEGIIDIND